MTRKDYIACAAIIAKTLPVGKRADIAAEFCKLYAADNPAFNHERFLSACFPEKSKGKV